MDDTHLWSDEEWRKKLSSSEMNDLPDSSFAYIEPGGKKDEDGKTTPRSLRHFAIHDAAHVRNALARAPQSPFGPKAMPKIKAAAKKFGIEVSDDEKNAADDLETRESNDGADTACDLCDGSGKIRNGSRKCPQCGGSGKTGEATAGDGDEQKAFASALDYRKSKAKELRGHQERRTFGAENVELRSAADGKLKFSGYASVTGTPYDVGFYKETIQRGAFKRTLGEDPDVQLLINHGDGGCGMPIARTNRNMTLTEDDHGLRVDADLDPEDPDVQLLARKMKNGLIDQMSFAFQATDQDWNDDYTERTIKVCTIHRGDVSVVNQGASATTTAAIRSREVLSALHALGGGEAFVDALIEWRHHTLLPMEARAGKSLSANTMEVLTKILELVQRADDSVDQAIPMLAELMNVPNPNDQGNHNSDGSPKTSANDKSASANVDGPTMSTSTDGRSLDMAAKRRAERRRLEALGGKR